MAGGVGDRPLHLATSKGYLSIVQLLVNGSQHSKADGRFELTMAKVKKKKYHFHPENNAYLVSLKEHDSS